jgi:hypothetical protein
VSKNIKISPSLFLFVLFSILSLLAFQLSAGAGSEIRDVAVTDVIVSSIWIVPAEICVINATVENQGSSTETFNVTAHYQIKMEMGNDTVYGGNETIQTVTVLNLGPGENGTITFFWWPYPQRWDLFAAIWPIYPPGNVTVRIKVEADVIPDEIDTADNVYVDGEVTLTWMIPDGDGDGVMNMRDIAMIARKFGGYDPAYDFNQDGKIDMRDIAVSARHFGMTYF